MCDPSLTDTGGRSSEFPEELEPWKEVDLTDVEEKMRGLKMEQEADFSEPEQVQLVQPVLAVGSALPSTSSTPSPAADGTLPASGAEGALPTSGDGAKHVAEEKKKVIVKAAPSSAQKALAELKPFLRFADGKDSDTEPPKGKATALPRAPSMNRSRSKSKQERKEKERQSSKGRKLLAAGVDLFHLAPVIVSSAAFWVSLSWLALLQMLTRCRFTTPLTLLCPLPQ